MMLNDEWSSIEDAAKHPHLTGCISGGRVKGPGASSAHSNDETVPENVFCHARVLVTNEHRKA